MCAGVGAMVCGAAIQAAITFTWTLVQDVFIDGEDVNSSISHAAYDATFAFMNAFTGPLKFRIRPVARNFRSMGRALADWLERHEQTMTTKAALNGVNLIVDQLYAMR